jgi:hypothetical protein
VSTTLFAFDGHLRAASGQRAAVAPLGTEFEALEGGARQIFLEQPLGVIIDLVFDAQAQEPAVQKRVVVGLDWLALAANVEQHLQWQGLEQHFQPHQGVATAGIHRLELAVYHYQQRISHGAHFAQWVRLLHSLFKSDVAELRPLEVLEASHGPVLSCSRVTSNVSGRLLRRQGIFQLRVNLHMMQTYAQQNC